MEKWYLQPEQMLMLKSLGIDIKREALLFIRTGSGGSPVIGIYESNFVPLLNFHVEPIFTVHDLLRLLPQEIVGEYNKRQHQYFLNISYPEHIVSYDYTEFLNSSMDFPSELISIRSTCFIDALYMMLVWVLNNTNYIKVNGFTAGPVRCKVK